MSYTNTSTLITQSGTDTSLGAPPFTSLGTFAGQTYYSTGGKDLTITGSLTIPYNQCLVMSGQTLIISAGGTLLLAGNRIIDGNTHAHGTTQFANARNSGGGWNGEVVRSVGDTTNPAKFIVQNATVFINGPRGRGFWAQGPKDRVTTQGTYATILNVHDNVLQFRVDSSDTDGKIDTQAKNTYLGMALVLNQDPVLFNALIFGADGPELTTNSTPPVGPIVIELNDYDTSALSPTFTGNPTVSIAYGAVLNVINCEQGLDLRVRRIRRSGETYHGVVNVVRQVAITLQEGVTAVDDIVVGWEYTGVYKTGVRPFRTTSDYTYFTGIKQRETAGAGNTSCTVSVLLGVCANDNTADADTSFDTYVSGTLKGSETHTLYTGKYGYKKLATSCALAGIKTLEKQLTVEKVPTTGTSANAAGLSHISLDFATTTIAITASGTTGGALTETTWGDVYDRIQYLLYTKDYIARPDFTNVAGDTIDLGS
ncbi:hypothetical protein, partial [Thiolapillus sp.]|uniref:hypothetical protein n=3 Tax=Thiolapillus sp. TaxID=2017437 RepID=UPI003AF64643